MGNRIKTYAAFYICSTLIYSCAPKSADNSVKNETEPDSISVLATSKFSGQRANPFTIAASFDEKAETLANTILGIDYTEISADPGDDMPQFESATKFYITKFRRKQPIQNAFGKGILAMIIFQVWGFSDSTEANNRFMSWLNSMEHSGSEIQVNVPVAEIKSGPVLAITKGKQFYLLKTACMFRGADWPMIRNRFFERIASSQNGIEILCDRKGLQWQKK